MNNMTPEEMIMWGKPTTTNNSPGKSFMNPVETPLDLVPPRQTDSIVDLLKETQERLYRAEQLCWQEKPYHNNPIMKSIKEAQESLDTLGVKLKTLQKALETL